MTTETGIAIAVGLTLVGVAAYNAYLHREQILAMESLPHRIKGICLSQGRPKASKKDDSGGDGIVAQALTLLADPNIGPVVTNLLGDALTPAKAPGKGK